MITRNSLIYSVVRKWATANQRTLKSLAREVGMSYPTMMAVLTGRTFYNPEAEIKISKVIGSNPWEKYPAIPYPENKEDTTWNN